ncbi:hypothetical protein NPS70_17405 [Streptomyces sp. C10-9-1]|uniref:hypothetical protein n=1 Tax=Streptomyces sp. C10-9-1 TaxID=1859285 RepID=UPI002112839A|nr:hypothetical protein [Streptomyces sp. C10-9-1]MCQ6554957.1 hypothetical protein [Streptomyces sp. C10-9-1]
MSGLAFAVPWLVPVSTLWAILPLVCPGRRRAGVVVALSHLVVTLAVTRPWTEDWYWRDGSWLVLVFGQGALVALGRLVFEISPLGARRHRTTRRHPDGEPVVPRPRP